MQNTHKASVNDGMRRRAPILLLLVLSTWLISQVATCETEDQCLMSWMHPIYDRIPLHGPTSYKYALYRYKEGGGGGGQRPGGTRVHHEERHVPLLFVHGNAGSYKQARSLGVSLHTLLPVVLGHQWSRVGAAKVRDSHLGRVEAMYANDRAYLASVLSNTMGRDDGGRVTTVLDVYTVDFEEELSGLHGHLLMQQAHFVNQCIRHILQMEQYKENGVGNVIAVGHSMGGLVVRAAYMAENFLSRSVNTVITMSTPHRDHPFPMDPSIKWFYRALNRFWREQLQVEGSDVANTALVSVAGGLRDKLIRTDNTLIDSLVPSSNGFSASVYSMPGARVSADHLSILWCRQVIRVVAVALLDMVNASDEHGHIPLKKRLDILRRQLVSPLASSEYGSNNITEMLQLPVDARVPRLKRSEVEPTVISEMEGTFSHLNPPKSHILELQCSSGLGLVMATNADKHQFTLYGVKHQRGTEKDDELDNLQNFVEVLPYVRKREYHMEVKSYPAELTHTIAFVEQHVVSRYRAVIIQFQDPKTVQSNTFRLSYEFFSHEESTMINPIGFEKLLAIGEKNVASISGAATLAFPYLGHQYAYTILLEQQAKTDENVVNKPIGEKCVPESAQLLPFAYFWSGQTLSSSIQLMEERMQEDARQFQVRFTHSDRRADDQGIQIFLFSQPHCTTRVSVSVSHLGILENQVQFNTVHMVSIAFVTFFFALAHQTSRSFSVGFLQSFVTIFFTRLTPLYFVVLPATRHSFPDVFYLMYRADAFVSQIFALLFSSYLPLDGTSDTDFISNYRPYNLHHHAYLYVVLSALCAFAFLIILYLVMRVLLFVLGLTIVPLCHIVSKRILDKSSKGYLWIFVCSILSVVGFTVIHSGVCLAILLVGMLLSSPPSRDKYGKAHDRLHQSLIIAILLSSAIVAPSVVIWVKELLLSLSALRISSPAATTLGSLGQLLFRKPDVNSIVEQAQSVLTSVDAFPVLLLPVFWCVASVSGLFHINDEHDNMASKEIPRREQMVQTKKRSWRWASWAFEIAAWYVMCFAGFAVHRAVYAVSGTLFILFLRNALLL